MGFLTDDKPIFSLEINDHVKSLLLNMARWTKFLAIFGFVLMGLMAVALCISIITGQGMANAGNAGQAGYLFGTMIGAVIALVGIYFYPTYALLMYSSRIRKAFAATNQEQFESALKYLKNSFRYVSILMIICLVLYGFALIFLTLAAVKSGM